jgi:hypothetical protein
MNFHVSPNNAQYEITLFASSDWQKEKKTSGSQWVIWSISQSHYVNNQSEQGREHTRFYTLIWRKHIGFEDVRAVTAKNMISLNVMPCSLVEIPDDLAEHTASIFKVQK